MAASSRDVAEMSSHDIPKLLERVSVGSSRVANADLRAIAVCPGCERQTGFSALTAEEEKKYMAGSIATGSMPLSDPRKIPKRLLRAWRSKDTIKCIDCGTHATLRPSCKHYNIAAIGIGVCPHCGEEFM